MYTSIKCSNGFLWLLFLLCSKKNWVPLRRFAWSSDAMQPISRSRTEWWIVRMSHLQLSLNHWHLSTKVVILSLKFNPKTLSKVIFRPPTVYKVLYIVQCVLSQNDFLTIFWVYFGQIRGILLKLRIQYSGASAFGYKL